MRRVLGAIKLLSLKVNPKVEQRFDSERDLSRALDL